MTARRILFWVHLTAGAMAGLVILVMSVTGVLLAYKRQIMRWADGSLQGCRHRGAACSGITLRPGAREITSMEDFSSYNRGRRLRLWARFTHTGEAFGAMGQTIAGIASLGASLLVFTGLSLALRRLAGWKERRTLKSEEAESSRIAV
jgi:uncharacterized iron-regulated membrane protein